MNKNKINSECISFESISCHKIHLLKTPETICLNYHFSFIIVKCMPISLRRHQMYTERRPFSFATSWYKNVKGVKVPVIPTAL